VDNGKKLTRRNSAGEVTQYGFRSPWNLLPLETWARAGGSYIVSDDRKQSGLTTRKTMEAIQFLQDLSYQHEIMPPVGVPLPGISFNAGTLAMQHDGHWNVPVLLETEGLRWAMADYPHRAGEERRTVFGGGSFSVTKATKHPDAAWKLALFVSSDEAQRAIVQNGISMPVRRSMMEYAVTSTAQYDQRIFVEALEYAVPNPVFPNYLEAQRILNQGLAPVRTGQRGALEYIPSIAQAFAEAIY